MRPIRSCSRQAIAHRSSDLPCQDWRYGIAHLSFGLSQFRFKDKAIWKRLESRCFPHRNAAWKTVMVLDVPMTFGPNRIGRPVGIESPIPLLRTCVRAAPYMIDRRAFFQALQVCDCLSGRHPRGSSALRRGGDKGLCVGGCSDDEHALPSLGDAIIGGKVQVVKYPVSQLFKVLYDSSKGLLVVLHQQALHVFGDEHSWTCPPDALDHSFVETATVAVNNACTLPVDGNVLAWKSADQYIRLLWHRADGVPDIGTVDVFSQIASIGSARGLVVVICPHNSEGQVFVPTP